MFSVKGFFGKNSVNKNVLLGYEVISLGAYLKNPENAYVQVNTLIALCFILKHCVDGLTTSSKSLVVRAMSHSYGKYNPTVDSIPESENDGLTRRLQS